MIIILIFAFIAGFITIFSPCILSIAPILLTAGTQQHYYKPLGIISGIILSFSFFTLTLSSIIQITGISPDILRSIAIIVIIFFGLTMIIPSLENIFTIMTNKISSIGNVLEQKSTQIKREFISGMILGIALGLIWTPCAGPILATVSSLAATHGLTFTTILITIFYSLGAAVPMLAFCFGGNKIINSIPTIAPYTNIIRKISGILIILSALAIAFHADLFIQEKIAHLFPAIEIEKNTVLQKELDMLKKTASSSNKPVRRSLGEGRAPELIGITDWINSQPLTLSQLRKKVVLIDFWTYTCINCIRTLPHVVEWYNTYKDLGLEIIGVHTPEFAFEKNKNHVENAVKKFNITYPVALDNDYKTWQAYNNHYWPAHYLIDQHGTIVKTHFGEGHYIEMENAICALLNLPACKKTEKISSDRPLTPETYLGFERADKYHPSLHIQKNKPTNYQCIKTLSNNQICLDGTWTIMPNSIQSNSDTCSLELNFIANHVYLVMQSDTPQLITILLDNKPIQQQYYTHDMTTQGEILVSEPRMYELINLKNDYGRHTLTLQCHKGLNAYVFTFGS